ncbi:MAG: 3-isopropylmalate dehydratase small subunit [Patescibacteria group bacterium]
MKNIQGQAQIFARNDIDTDLIIPASYLTSSDQAELAKHVLEALGGAKLQKTEKPIVIAGENFGCGSSREHAVWALSGAGVQAVIADSFARIFFRNSINFGLPTFVLSEASKKFAENDQVEIDLVNAKIKNLTQKTEFAFEPVPAFLQKIVTAGGLLNQI